MLILKTSEKQLYMSVATNIYSPKLKGSKKYIAITVHGERVNDVRQRGTYHVGIGVDA